MLLRNFGGFLSNYVVLKTTISCSRFQLNLTLGIHEMNLISVHIYQRKRSLTRTRYTWDVDITSKIYFKESRWEIMASSG
jgi:hypothetical protein